MYKYTNKYEEINKRKISCSKIYRYKWGECSHTVATGTSAALTRHCSQTVATGTSAALTGYCSQTVATGTSAALTGECSQTVATGTSAALTAAGEILGNGINLLNGIAVWRGTVFILK
jgi:hypothetical protein